MAFHLVSIAVLDVDIMASKTAVTCLRRFRSSHVGHLQRAFSASAQTRTDGVFRALTTQRNEKPWVEAFREQQAKDSNAKGASGQSSALKDRDLSPKRMSDSYHSVVCLVHVMNAQLTD